MLGMLRVLFLILNRGVQCRLNRVLENLALRQQLAVPAAKYPRRALLLMIGFSGLSCEGFGQAGDRSLGVITPAITTDFNRVQQKSTPLLPKQIRPFIEICWNSQKISAFD